MSDRFVRLLIGISKDYAPLYPIELLLRERFRLVRFLRFIRGDNKLFAPM